MRALVKMGLGVVLLAGCGSAPPAESPLAVSSAVWTQAPQSQFVPVTFGLDRMMDVVGHEFFPVRLDEAG
jgi:hypothetical protein